MRWKLLRRRLSVSAPRMIVRSHFPWPVRMALAALVLGFSAALALWAFELGKSIAGLDRDAKEELAQLRVEVAELRGEREKATSTANTAESLLKTEKVAQEKLAEQIKLIEAENLALKNDLGFFQRLLPTSGSDGLSIRSLQAETPLPGQLRFQLLVMQQGGKNVPEFQGRYEVTLAGLNDGRPWSMVQPGGAKPLQMKQYLRVEGIIDHPPQAVVKAVSVRVIDMNGAVRATQAVKL